jgi:hypothetical protein
MGPYQIDLIEKNAGAISGAVRRRDIPLKTDIGFAFAAQWQRVDASGTRVVARD